MINIDTKETENNKEWYVFFAGKDMPLKMAMISITNDATTKRKSAIDPGEKYSNADLIPENAEAQKAMAIANAIVMRIPSSLCTKCDSF